MTHPFHTAVFVLSFVVARQLPFRSHYNFIKTAASKTGEFSKKACSMGGVGRYFFIKNSIQKLDVEFPKDLEMKTR